MKAKVTLIQQFYRTIKVEVEAGNKRPSEISDEVQQRDYDGEFEDLWADAELHQSDDWVDDVEIGV